MAAGSLCPQRATSRSSTPTRASSFWGACRCLHRPWCALRMGSSLPQGSTFTCFLMRPSRRIRASAVVATKTRHPNCPQSTHTLPHLNGTWWPRTTMLTLRCMIFCLNDKRIVMVLFQISKKKKKKEKRKETEKKPLQKKQPFLHLFLLLLLVLSPFFFCHLSVFFAFFY